MVESEDHPFLESVSEQGRRHADCGPFPVQAVTPRLLASGLALAQQGAGLSASRMLSPASAPPRPVAAVLALLGALLAPMAAGGADIYRYQDEQGNWVFTDRPPPTIMPAVPRAGPATEPYQRVEPVPAIVAPRVLPATNGASGPQAAAPPAPLSAGGLPVSPTPGAAGSPGIWPPAGRPPPAPALEPEPPPPPDPRPDLAARMMRHFSPVTPVEMSSLAVVTVNSELGAGSGFFVSEGGLLLTNRHVVRPPPDWAAGELAALAQLKDKLDALEQRLSLPRDRYSDPNDYDRGRRVFRERSRAYRQAKRDLEIKRDAALLQRAFEIQLKDGERLTAELVEVSAAYDLALLRVSGYRTPFVRPLLGARLRQTQRVYAIGSPLGIKDTVTAGTFTGERDGMLVTDAQILPGNSGGPLVTEQGFVVAINTWKATPEPEAAARGFGVSIPIDIAFAEFPDLHALREGEAAETAPR